MWWMENNCSSCGLFHWLLDFSEKEANLQCSSQNSGASFSRTKVFSNIKHMTQLQRKARCKASVYITIVWDQGTFFGQNTNFPFLDTTPKRILPLYTWAVSFNAWGNYKGLFSSQYCFLVYLYYWTWDPIISHNDVLYVVQSVLVLSGRLGLEQVLRGLSGFPVTPGLQVPAPVSE